MVQKPSHFYYAFTCKLWVWNEFYVYGTDFYMMRTKKNNALWILKVTVWVYMVICGFGTLHITAWRYCLYKHNNIDLRNWKLIKIYNASGVQGNNKYQMFHLANNNRIKMLCMWCWANVNCDTWRKWMICFYPH